MATKDNKDKDKASAKAEDKKVAPKEEKASSSKAGAKAEKEADADEGMDEGEELDSLLEVLEEEDLASLDLETAAEMIDQWYDILHKSDDEKLKEVANTLKQLKKKVGASKPKPADIAEILSQLGEQVDGAADSAERGYKTKMHKLGKSIRKAGRDLESEENAE